MMLSGIISGAILSWVTNDFRTLYFYPPLQCQNKNNDCSHFIQRFSEGNYGVAAALSTILTVLTVGSLALVYENL